MCPPKFEHKNIHGMARHGLRSGTDMDEADAQRIYTPEVDCKTKREKREMIIDLPLRKRMKWLSS